MYCYLNYIHVEHFFGAGVLGPPVWEPSPKILGGHVGAPKTNLSVPLPATILGAPVEMLAPLKWQLAQVILKPFWGAGDNADFGIRGSGFPAVPPSQMLVSNFLSQI
jgi:hypothetical protein